MFRYTLRRLAQLIPVLVGISLLDFALLELIPGDPAQAILGPYATASNLASLRAQLGLDQPFWAQYWTWLTHAIDGNLGISYSLNLPVVTVVFHHLGNTLVLAAVALIICLAVGMVAGVVAAVWRGRWPDRVATTLALMGLSTPTFWLAMIMVLVFAVSLGWFPASGMYRPYGGGGLGDLGLHLVLPAVTLGLAASGVIARLTRSSMLEVLGEDYLRTARSKGLSEYVVILKHALKNAMVTIIPVIGVQIGFLLSGAIYVETIFDWPGVGSMLVTAISTRDILLVQGGVLIVAIVYVLLNLLVDLLQAAVDPRIRAQ